MERRTHLEKIVEFPIGIVSKGMPNPGVDITWPVHLEPKIPTMGKKLIINVAPTGALMSRKQNPTQPYNSQEIAKEVVEAYKAGASVFHIHVRDDGKFTVDSEIYKKTLDLVFKEAPDIVVNLCTVYSATHEGVEKRMKPLIEPLLKYGRKYTEIAVINPVTYAVGQLPPFIATPAGVQEETGYLEDVGVKPMLGGYHAPAISDIKEYLIETGIAKKPYFFALCAGIHNSTPSTPNPEGFVNLIQMVRQLPEDSVWEADMGGRNWLPMAVLAIMLGADSIRVGKEDTLYMYPHKDDIIKSCADTVKKIATIAKELGREIAKPDEARKILGIKTQSN
jgi:3-keto-5-aminohexanoate cleavage enzyme